jgi:hypothetical protein
MIDDGLRPGADETPDPTAARLVATLERRAAEVDDGPRFAAAEVIGAGRRTLRRRRTAAGAAAVAVLVALLTVPQIARTAAPPPSTPARPAAAPSSSGAGVDLLAGNTVHRADGSRVDLGLPAGVTASLAFRVRSGWVVEAERSDSIEAWFVPDQGTPRRVGTAFGGLAVSPDGGTLVVVPGGDDVVAYELPSLREIGRHRFDDGIGPAVVGVSRDVAVLKGAQGDGTSSRAAVWNFRTGSFTATSRSLRTWGISDDGQVLRGVDGCVDLVPVSGALAVGRTGWCGTDGRSPVRGAGVSPDGRWVSLEIDPADGSDTTTAVLIHAADLRAGRWRPVPTGGPADVEGLTWVTGSTFVLLLPGGALQRCEAGVRCGAVVAAPADPRIVVPRTAG